jgi:Ankyrin repeats (3 copies)
MSYCIETKGASATKLVIDGGGDGDCSTTSGSGAGQNHLLLWKDCLLAAIEEGSSHVVEYLLTRGGANANAHTQKPLGQPSVAALWLAAQLGHVYIIQLLVRHGAHINACKHDTGNTALFVAAQNGHALACSVLIQHGADLSKSLKQPLPMPPLGIAIGAARPDIMALLLNAGANVPAVCASIWHQVLEREQSNNIPRPLREDVLYQIKVLVEQATECTLLDHTNQLVRKHYQRARELEYKGKYRQALRALVEAHTAYLQFNKYHEPRQLQPSPPAWVQLKLDGERLTNYVYGCQGSDGRVSKWKRHVFYKDDLAATKVISLHWSILCSSPKNVSLRRHENGTHACTDRGISAVGI